MSPFGNSYVVYNLFINIHNGSHWFSLVGILSVCNAQR